MEEIFQELLLSVGISVAVCCMIMKLKPYSDGEGGEACKRRYDGTKRVGVSRQNSEEQKLSFGSGKNRGAWAWPLDEMFKQLSAEKFYETNVTDHGETASELVEDEAAMLQDLRIEEESVGGDESKGIFQEICNMVDDREVGAEIIEEVDVFRRLRRKEDVYGCIERFSVNEIEECLENHVEENLLRLDNQEIQDEYNRLGDVRTDKGNFGEIEQGLYEDDRLSQARIEEISQISSIEDGEESENRGEKEEEGLFDDWEGVDRTELEKLFGAAVVFVCSKCNASFIDRNMKIELYGLHKIAIEGPCRGAQPMALNISARAKWYSWKKLGNMSRELAMEQYLLILSERVPAWTRSVEQSHH